MLTVKNLKKKIGLKTLLNDVSFELPKGQIGIFLGGSGVGKSTLLRVLNHLETYDSGEFALEGEPLNLSKANKEHTMGMVFQHFNLFEHLSVLENITLSLVKLQKKSKTEATQIAKDLLISYGLEAKIHDSVHKLSGGQKQRLAIARTLALNPRVICLDEPTSALDPLLTNQVIHYISEMANQGRTVLIATHDMNLVKKLEGTLFLMNEGQIVERVSISQYHKNPQNYQLVNQFINN